MDTEQLRKLLLYMWCSEEQSDEALKAAVRALLKKVHTALDAYDDQAGPGSKTN